MKKTIVALLIILLLSLCFCSCARSHESDFSKEGAFEVIFIDVENSSDASIHYDGAKNDRSLGYSGVKPADCYLIKTGDIEILVDAGFQLQSPIGEIYYQRIAQIYQQNVIKKIEKYCTDGVLEYLIVTHADFDHIVGAAIDGGILDYVYNSDNTADAVIKKIGTVIDFDSDLVVYLSDANGNNIFPSGQNRLLKSEIVDMYRVKRDLLVKDKGTKHIPAAAFFKGTTFLQDNVMTNAMPDEYLTKYFRLDKYDQLTDQVNTMYLTNFYYFSDNTIVHNECSALTKQPKPANLNFQTTYADLKIDERQLKEENERYYYSIDLNGVELRILYNWCYDHFYRHSFDSQDQNNISVCFEVVSGNSKFASFGDLGTGETGLIRYYKDTSILKNVTCFKASHHGSTTNGENSSKLFQLMTPKVVIVTGVAQINRDILKKNNMTNDSIFAGLNGAAVMKEDFFENVLSADPETKIYCTQIAQLLKEEDSGKKFSLIAASFYGDVFLRCYSNRYEVDSSFKGDVEGYVSGASDRSRHLIFPNCSGSEMLSYCETEYYKAIYEKEGKI